MVIFRRDNHGEHLEVESFKFEIAQIIIMKKLK